MNNQCKRPSPAPSCSRPVRLGVVSLSLGSLALFQSADEREPGGGDLWDVPLGLVEVGHGGVQAAPGNLVGVVHLQSRRGAVPVLGWQREVCNCRLFTGMH